MQPADEPITVVIAPSAQQMIDEAVEHWSSVHGDLDDNPLIDQIQRAGCLLQAHPQLGLLVRRGLFRYETRSLPLASGWRLYERVHAQRRLVEVVVVWSGRRATGPRR